ncbi:MAG: hypothetical protein Kow006_24270 [Gammaproteobacteria bacterium]
MEGETGTLAELPDRCRSAADFLRCIEIFRASPVIIYGAGKIGRRIYECLCRFDVAVSAFWDLRADLINDITDVPVTQPDLQGKDRDRWQDPIVIVTVFAENVSRSIAEQLHAAGYGRTILDRDFISSMLYFNCREARDAGKYEFQLATCHSCPVPKTHSQDCDIFEESIAYTLARDVARPLPDDSLVIRSMGVLISNKCTLTCVGCNHLRDHYQPADQVDLEPDQIIADIARIVDAVDLVRTVVLVGGEALLHRHFETIFDRVMQLPKIGMVHVITNGTVIPKRHGLFNKLADPRVFVEVSGYGDHLPRPLKGNVTRFLDLLVRHGVTHQYVKTLQWFDFGGFEDRGYTPEEHQRVYESCCFISNDLFDGKLYKCSRSAYGTHIGKIQDFPADYVTVRDTDPQPLRRQLRAFLANRRPVVCRFCNGASTAVIPAGQQVKFVKKRAANQ